MLGLAAVAVAAVLAVVITTVLRKREGLAGDGFVYLWTEADERGTQTAFYPRGQKSTLFKLSGRQRYKSINVSPGYRVKIFAYTGNSAVLWREVRGGKTNLAPPYDMVQSLKVVRI